MTLDILILLIIMTYFVGDGQNELADYLKKNKIVNKIESRLTRAFIKYQNVQINEPHHISLDDSWYLFVYIWHIL